MKDVSEVVMNYKQMEKMGVGSSILREVREQYADMSKGGNGGRLHFKPNDWNGTHPDGPTCREYNYPGYPDSFFQEVRDLMEWK